MNHVVLMGRLVRDPETRTTQSGMLVGRYTLAVDRIKKDEADFISCITFGKTAEFVEKYLHKGMKIAIEGRLQTGSYEKDGKKVYTTDVIVNSHEFADGKAQNTEPKTITSTYVAPDIAVDEELPF